MKREQHTTILTVLSTLLVTTWCATHVLGGVAFYEIPMVLGDLDNEGRAITPDGQFVVGLSGVPESTTSHGFLYQVGAGSAINIYSADNAQATIATGVGYRTSGTTTELIIAGRSYAAGNYSPTEWMTTDGGATFTSKRRTASFVVNTIPAANMLGASTASDVYYVTSGLDISGEPVYLNQLAGPWIPTITYSQKGITKPARSLMNGVSASGRAAGWRTDSTDTYRQNYMITWNGTATPAPVFFNGLDGSTAGEAFSISADGNTIFGRSPTVSDPYSTYAYKVENPGPSQTINALPEFPDTAGSGTRAVPYGCTPDGKYAVGMNYRGTEEAVVWDTSDPDPAKWTVLDLTELAKFLGLNGSFTRLNRAYSVGTNGTGLVITGVGIWQPEEPIYARAFVMTVPLPLAPVVRLSSAGGLYTLSYLGLGNATTVLEYTTNLSLPNLWSPLDSSTSGSTATYDDVAPADPQRFYRARLQ